MTISLHQIKELRAQTGVSMTECKKALEEALGNNEKAIEILRKKGAAKALDRSKKSTSEGLVVSYIHSNNKIGVLAEISCETDFVARSDAFKELSHDIAMQIAATNPLTISPDDIPADLIDKEKEIWHEQLKNEGKPENIVPKIIVGKENKFREENALLTQQFVKNPNITIEKLLNEYVTKLGENILIKRFSRYQI